MAQEPILWVRPGYTPPRRLLPGPDGDVIVEKFPATAPPPEDHPMHGRPVKRWDKMLSDDGNVYSVVWTGGAADYDVDNRHYGQALKQRQRSMGWFPYGECPLRLVVAGQFDPRFLSPALRALDMRGEACAPGTCNASKPCRHTVAEEAHRKDRHTRREKNRATAFRSEAEKIMQATQEQQKATGDATVAIVEKLSAALASLTGGSWPMNRPNMTPEEYVEQAKAAAPPAPSGASDDELVAMMAAADLEDGDQAPAGDPPPPRRKGGR